MYNCSYFVNSLSTVETYELLKLHAMLCALLCVFVFILFFVVTAALVGCNEWMKRRNADEGNETETNSIFFHRKSSVECLKVISLCCKTWMLWINQNITFYFSHSEVLFSLPQSLLARPSLSLLLSFQAAEKTTLYIFLECSYNLFMSWDGCSLTHSS